MVLLFIIIFSVFIYFILSLGNTQYIVMDKSSTLSIEDLLHRNYGDIYPYIYDYDYVYLFNKVILVARIYTVTTSLVSEKSLEDIVSIAANMDYNQNQPNPNLLLEYGGNCQALTLFVLEWAKKHGVEYEIFYVNEEHMWCCVYSEGYMYKFDTLNGNITIGLRELIL